MTIELSTFFVRRGEMYKHTIDFIETMYQQAIIPGANYLFYKQGNLFKGNIGYQQILPFKKEVSPKTIYDMASLTKVMMTNTIVLKLLESGEIHLDDSLNKHLVSWHESTVTLRHLLTHTSGINAYIKNRDDLSAKELKEALLQLPVDSSKIGQEKVYTDTGTILIGFMLEEIYGKNVQQLFTEHVLNPLNMSESGFTFIDEKYCSPTENTSNRGIILGDVHDPKAFKLKEHCASAGLFSNIDDTWKFVDMMLNYGKLPSGELFLQEETISQLLTDHTPTKNLSRSIGWDLKYHFSTNHPILFHTGYTGTFIMLDIIGQEAFIFLSNRVHPVDNREEYLDARDRLLNIYQKEQTK